MGLASNSFEDALFIRDAADGFASRERMGRIAEWIWNFPRRSSDALDRVPSITVRREPTFQFRLTASPDNTAVRDNRLDTDVAPCSFSAAAALRASRRCQHDSSSMMPKLRAPLDDRRLDVHDFTCPLRAALVDDGQVASDTFGRARCAHHAADIRRD